MKLKTNIKISAPASIANIACGFDVLGLAINTPCDEIVVTEADQPGIHITQIIKNKTKLSTDIDKNTAGLAAQTLLNFLQKERGLDKNIGLNFKLTKHIPIGFGLGSSSASAVAGVMAVNEALNCPLQKRELVHFAAIGEQLAEGQYRINSITPSLIGGLVLTRDHKTLDFHRLPLPKGLKIVVIYPKNRYLISKHVRDNLSRKIYLEHALKQVANIGALVHALYMSDFDLLARALEDNIAENHWSNLIPFFKEIQQAAYNNHALGCSIAGTGSGVFAICKNSLEASNAASAMEAILEENGIKSKTVISDINQEGAIKT